MKQQISKIIEILLTELSPKLSYEERIKIYEIVEDFKALAAGKLSDNKIYNPFDMTRGNNDEN